MATGKVLTHSWREVLNNVLFHFSADKLENKSKSIN